MQNFEPMKRTNPRRHDNVADRSRTSQAKAATIARKRQRKVKYS